MKLKRIALYYLVGYLVPTGLGLIFVPDLVFKLLFSNGSYGDVIPRLSGSLILALGIIAAEVLRKGIDLYVGLIAARVQLMGVLIALYVYTKDPFFVAVLAVVGIGVVLTTIACIKEGHGVTA
jgi:hypothetical protein